MKAVAVFPNNGGAHLIDVAQPTLDELPHGRGVIVKVLAVGVDGTDKEILAGEYGSPPPGEAYLITGLESFGIVEAVGPDVRTLRPTDYVVATVRRPGSSVYDAIGTPDFTTDDVYYERGINLRHGFLTERYLENEEFLVPVPPGLRDVGVRLPRDPARAGRSGLRQAATRVACAARRLRLPRARFSKAAAQFHLVGQPQGRRGPTSFSPFAVGQV
jgi:threonine dehydrogenase-like Zn-dependent dehydrogenase